MHAAHTCTESTLPITYWGLCWCRVLPSPIHETRTACARRCVGFCSIRGCRNHLATFVNVTSPAWGVIFVLSLLQSGWPVPFQTHAQYAALSTSIVQSGSVYSWPDSAGEALGLTIACPFSVYYRVCIGPTLVVAVAYVVPAWLKLYATLRMSITLPWKSIFC